MKLKVFSVYDSKVQCYAQPFMLRSKGEALRGWQDAVNDQTTNLYRHSGDFSLFEIAEFDDQTGVITMHQAKVNLGGAIEFRRTTPDTVPEVSDASLESIGKIANKALNGLATQTTQ